MYSIFATWKRSCWQRAQRNTHIRRFRRTLKRHHSIFNWLGMADFSTSIWHLGHNGLNFADSPGLGSVGEQSLNCIFTFKLHPASRGKLYCSIERPPTVIDRLLRLIHLFHFVLSLMRSAALCNTKHSLMDAVKCWDAAAWQSQLCV